jgi:hypothetical protein
MWQTYTKLWVDEGWDNESQDVAWWCSDPQNVSGFEFRRFVFFYCSFPLPFFSSFFSLGVISEVAPSQQWIIQPDLSFINYCSRAIYTSVVLRMGGSNPLFL